MEQHNLDERILDYLDGRMNPNEKTKFESLIEGDKDLKERVREFKLVINGIHKEGQEEIRKIISSISDNKIELQNTNYKKHNMKENKVNKSYLWIAASFLLLAGAAYFFLQSNDEFDADKFLAESYQKDYKNVDSDLKSIATKNIKTRGVTPDDTMTVVFKGQRIKTFEFELLEQVRRDSLVLGINTFKKGNWQTAVKKLYSYTEQYKDPANDYQTALFYLAKSKLNNGNYAYAINNFNEFLASNNSDKSLKETAEWDRAICYMKVDASKVKTYLDEMAQDNGHSYQDDAKGLIAYFD